MCAAKAQPMTTILLSGSLAKAFGRKHIRLLETGTTAEAFSALKHTLLGFDDFIRDSARRGLRYVIFRNRENIGESEFTLSGTTEIRIVPVVSGSKNGGLFQVVAGIALMVSAIWLGPTAFYTGLTMTLGGVAQMLTPTPKAPSQQEQASTENKPSYFFNGAFNSSQQGLPMPVIYGKMLSGSMVVSVGTWTEALPT